MENKKKLKGIVLAGGSGSRLWPITLSTSKQLLPIYDKPMIYYPLSVLMLAGIKEISIITNKEYINHFKNLLGYGEEFGINLSFTIQEKPNGLAEAFILEQEFIGDDNVALILGDNIFHGRDFSKLLDEAANIDRGATIFGCYVNDPERYGVVDFKNKTFRKGLPEDYITKCTEINYVPLSSSKHKENIPLLHDFMAKIFVNEQLREYMWNHLAGVLIGMPSLNQSLYNYIGFGHCDDFLVETS